MSLQISARAMSVIPRENGLYGVTLGPGDQLIWLVTRDPPRLGDLVTIERATCSKRRIPESSSELLVVEDGEITISPSPYPRRVVDPRWISFAQLLSKRRLLPFQAEGAAWLATRLITSGGAILCDDPGLGKTIQALIALAISRCLPAIVVCPTGVKGGWLDEVQQLRPRLRILCVDHREGDLPPAHILLLSYHVLRARERQLRQTGAKAIVFDEGHLLKEPSPSSRHRAAAGTRLAHHIGRSIILTGTPIINRPKELWRLLHIADRQGWANLSEYHQRYCTAPQRGEPAYDDVIITSHASVKRIRELQVRTEPLILRRRRDEVLRGMLLPKRHSMIGIQLEPQDRASYDAAEQDVITWLRRVVGEERAERAVRGQAIVKITMLRRIAAIGKLRRAARQYLESWIRERKDPLVIFAHHRAVLAGVVRICAELRQPTSVILGSMSSSKRKEQIDRFQRGNSRIFVGPIQAAGMGINLFRARHMLCLERLWSPSVMEQMESRCHRIGQAHEVEITYMDAEDTVDEHIRQVLTSKQQVISRVVDSRPAETPSGDAQSLDEVIQRMIRRPQRQAISAAPPGASR